MSNGAALTLGPLRLVARWSLRTADHAGRFSFLIADMLRGLAEWRIWVPRTLEQATAVGYGSLFIVLLVAGFAGAVTSLQTGYQFTGALPLYYAGAVISESMILELGPVLTALILAGRIGARYAAELGTMRVTEQIDALESLGRSPVSHLLIPRVVAGLLVIPALTMFANATGIVVGYLTAKGSLASRTATSSTGRATSSDRSTSGTRPSRAAASRPRSRPSLATWASTPSRAPKGWDAPPRRRWCPRRWRS